MKWPKTPGLLEVVGLGAAASVLLALHKRVRGDPDVDPLVREYPRLCERYPHVAAELSHFVALRRDDRLRDVCRFIDEMARADAERRPSSQWAMSRLCGKADKALTVLLSEVETWTSDDLFYHKQFVEEDCVPALHDLMEAIVHNHLLDMAR